MWTTVGRMANPLLAALDIEVESITDADRSAATLAVTLCLDRDHTRHSLSEALTVLFARHREQAFEEGMDRGVDIGMPWY